MNKEQIHILHHTLGYRDGQRRVDRNYFYTGAGSTDYPYCEELVALGFFKKWRDALDEINENYIYSATEAGKLYAEVVYVSSRLEKALREIAAIENRLTGVAWDEIEDAQEIARKALIGAAQDVSR